MKSADWLNPLRMFRKVVPERFIRDLCLEHGHGVREGIYSPSVVILAEDLAAAAGEREHGGSGAVSGAGRGC
jgi:hypothetical protein